MNGVLSRLGLISAGVLFSVSSFGAESEELLVPLHTVKLDAAVHGKVLLSPELPADGKYAQGTKVTVKAVPDEGFALDCIYTAQPGRWGFQYDEAMASERVVEIDRDMNIGASFVAESEVDHITVKHNVVYAKPGKKALKYDVFSPKGVKDLPCIVIIHGGGWVLNCEDVMRGLARELTKGGKLVVCSIDYRWAGKADGDEEGNTMADLIGDVYGAIAHIREHAAEYGADPDRIGLTGDSAGGHLSATASLMVNKIGEGGFGKKPGVFEFMPTYLPEGMTAEQLRTELLKSIKAAAPSYGVFASSSLNHYSNDPAANNSWKKEIAPQDNIPPASERAVPQFLVLGTQDELITDKMVSDFKAALETKGQRAEYVKVEGARHAFFDWKPDAQTKDAFLKYGVPYAAKMKAFFLETL